MAIDPSMPMTSMSEPDWRAIAELLYVRLRVTGTCLCEYQRTRSGVPMWFPADTSDPSLGIGRRLVKRCARHDALNAYESAAGLPLTDL